MYNQKYDYPPEMILSHTFFMNKTEEFYKFYKEFITKIYPKNGDFIYKEKEPSNKLYLVYQGKCAVQRNSKNLGNIIYLNKGDIFGYESLINLKPKWKTIIKINIQINIQKIMLFLTNMGYDESVGEFLAKYRLTEGYSWQHKKLQKAK